MSHPPAAKKARLNDGVSLTEDEIKVVKIQFEKDTAYPHFDALLREYCRFMELKVVNPNVPMAPSFLIDKLWHAHILSTRQYLAFCERHNQGAFLHHDPTMKQGQKRYKLTLDAYENMYGTKPDDQQIWPNHVDKKPRTVKQEADQKIKQESEDESGVKQEDNSKQEGESLTQIKQEAENTDVPVKQEGKDAPNGSQNDKKKGSLSAITVAEAQKRIQTLIAGHDGYVNLGGLPQLYQERFGERLDYKRLGFNKLKSFVQSVPRVDVEKCGNKWMLSPQTEQGHGGESTDSESEVGDLDDDDDEYDSDEREYLNDYGDERGTTEEELAEWHKNAIMDPANNEGCDPNETYQCYNAHKWINGEFSLHCEGCRESSNGLGGFTCG